MAAIAAQGGVAGGQCFTRIWIGGLPRNSSVDECKNELKRVFGDFGVVLDVCVITNAKDVMAFIQYENEQDAFRARETMNMATILGAVVKVNYAVIRSDDVQPNRAARQTSRSRSRERHRRRLNTLNGTVVLVEGFPSDVAPEEAAEAGAAASPGVTFANVFRDGRRTFALIAYESREQVVHARRWLDGARIDGRKLRAFTVNEYNEWRLTRARSPSR